MKNLNYSLIVPVYNEEAVLSEFYKRLKAVMETLDAAYEIIFINDGSSDNSLGLLTGFNKENSKVKIINLSRNFGQQSAVTAGLTLCTGEIVATIDADLQDPPELLPDFFAKIHDDNDVVYGISKKRNDPIIRKTFMGFYYTLMGKLSSVPIPENAGIFAAMRRPVVDALLTMPERNRFLPALRAWAGFKQMGISYDKPSRFAGRQSQSFSKLFKMGFDALFSFSYVPLRLATYLGIIVTFGAFLGILDVVYQKFWAHTAIIGWSGPMLSILIIGGAQLIILGIVGEYLGRIYDEVKNRPSFIISQKIGFN